MGLEADSAWFRENKRHFLDTHLGKKSVPLYT